MLIIYVTSVPSLLFTVHAPSPTCFFSTTLSDLYIYLPAMAMADALPFSKISIPGPTLSSLLHHSLSSSSSSLSGLLFGQLTSLPSSNPTDSDSSPSPSSLSLTITSFLSSPPPFLFFDSLGLINPNSPLLLQSPQNPNPNSSSSPLLLGWFSSRPFSPLRPSMRDLAVSHNLSKTLRSLNPPDSKPLIFLLFSAFSTSNHAIHTHEYRAFLLFGSQLRPVSLDVINVGPKFRGQYGSFLPEASSLFLPMMPCPARVSEQEEGFVGRRMENGGEMGVEWSVAGFGVERLEGLVGERTAEYAKEVEDLYGKMMEKLEGLVRMVEESSAKVQEQV